MHPDVIHASKQSELGKVRHLRFMSLTVTQMINDGWRKDVYIGLSSLL